MEPALNLAGIRTAGPMLRAIAELYNVLVILKTPKFENASQVDDFGTMNSSKASRVKLLSQGIHGFAQQVSSVSRVKFYVISGCGDPRHVFGRHY
jgi:hypothetical protein